MPFLKYETLAQTICKSIDALAQKLNTTGKKFEMPKKYRQRYTIYKIMGIRSELIIKKV